MCEYKVPKGKELDDIFNDMLKTASESRKIDCECCGYQSCEQMATAIYNGFNRKENCIHYIKAQVENDWMQLPKSMGVR